MHYYREGGIKIASIKAFCSSHFASSWAEVALGDFGGLVIAGDLDSGDFGGLVTTFEPPRMVAASRTIVEQVVEDDIAEMDMDPEDVL